ncbi:hypothetical protein EXIGLDRAFT_572066, partial [Exidia glandulosa HHB12029]
PPLWARLPSDTVPTHRTVSFSVLPPVLLLGDAELPHCRCGWTMTTQPERQQIQEIDCIVYGLQNAVRRRIQVVSCAVCPPRFGNYAGPDLGTLGLYNYNNKRVIAHSLLNDYSNNFTKIATPFNGYVEVVSRRYTESEEGDDHDLTFLSPDDFRTIWFGFERLQHNDIAFECITCGSNPRVIIADGISAGFDIKQLQATLRPPTLV